MVHASILNLARRRSILPGTKAGKVPTMLRPEVLKSSSISRGSCLQEMNQLLDCWNANNFDDRKCEQQVKKFLACGEVAVEKYHEVGRRKKGTVDRKKITEVLKANTLKRENGSSKTYENVPLNKWSG